MKKPTGANIALDTAHYNDEILAMMDNADNCLCCGIKLKYTDKEKRRNRGYCSLDCYYKYPPKMAYIAYKYKRPVRNVIVDMLNRGRTMNAVAGLLGIGKPQLYEYMEKLNIKKIVKYE